MDSIGPYMHHRRLLFGIALSVALARPGSCKCEQVASQTARVTHCNQGGGAGSFQIYAPDLNNSTQIRGRVVGDAIQELVFNYADVALWSARYSLPRGRYRAFAELHYHTLRSEMPENPPVTERNLIFDGLAFDVGVDRRRRGLCERGEGLFNTNGYWTVPPESVTMPTRYQETETGWPNPPNVRYDPGRCKLMEDGAIEECAEHLSVCIFGDSHMRHLTNSIIDPSFLNVIDTRSDHSSRASNALQYIDDAWGECFLGRFDGFVHGKLTDGGCGAPYNCSTVVVNFGQWYISHGLLGSPAAPRFSANEYGAAVVRAMANARIMFPWQRLIWTSMLPHGGGVRMMFTTPPEEWRVDSIIRRYNDAAESHLRRRSPYVEFFDIFRCSNAVHDFTYDGSHYKSPVGREIRRLMLHALCYKMIT